MQNILERKTYIWTSMYPTQVLYNIKDVSKADDGQYISIILNCDSTMAANHHISGHDFFTKMELMTADYSSRTAAQKKKKRITDILS